MKRLTHTKDSLKLVEFLLRYPNQWHGVQKDLKTSKAVKRVMELYPDNMEVVHYVGQAYDDMRFNQEVTQ